MQTEEGPGYADINPASAEGFRSDPWDIPRIKTRGTQMGLAAASAPGVSALYGGELPSYGLRAGDEAAEPPHGGLGAAAPSGDAGGVLPAGAVGSWPSHGLGDGFVSGGRHVLYCGADIPMEQLQSGHWHHEQRPEDVGNPLQAAASSPRAHQHLPGSLTTHRTSQPGGGYGAFRQEGGPMGQQASWAPVFVHRDRQDEPPQHAGEDTVEDDVVEVEADTPGGYHVAATVLHPADSDDPEEFVVAATSVMPPPRGGGAGASAY